ncbi:MAG: helix-turn-helix domain-containing protein [Eubacterium sp.]|nr:helix-turn-helix domain-containing protein [Eubacterium sp.]
MNQALDIMMVHECSGEHFHDYPQIMVPLNESMQIMIGSMQYDVTPQELCFVPTGMQHQCNFNGRMLVINLSDQLPESGEVVMISSPLIVPMRGQIVQLVELIQAELKQNPDSTAIRHLYKYLYAKIMENCAAPSIRYINDYYQLPITVDQLANIENYNVTYYCDWFKQKTGLSPSIYLRNTRILHAKELLTTTNYSVMEIAVMVGYSGNSTFTRAFHNVTGMTPKAYRDCACFKQPQAAPGGTPGGVS